MYFPTLFDPPAWQLCAAVKFFYVKLSFPIGGFLRITRNIIIKHPNLRQFKCHDMYETEFYMQNTKCRCSNVMEKMTLTQLNGVSKLRLYLDCILCCFVYGFAYNELIECHVLSKQDLE